MSQKIANQVCDWLTPKIIGRTFVLKGDFDQYIKKGQQITILSRWGSHAFKAPAFNVRPVGEDDCSYITSLESLQGCVDFGRSINRKLDQILNTSEIF